MKHRTQLAPVPADNLPDGDRMGLRREHGGCGMARRRKRNRAKGGVAGQPATRTELLRRRARRHAGRGDWRKAAVALREVAAIDGDPTHWTLLGNALHRARRGEEALRAFKQAAWLHRRAGSDRRAEVVTRLLGELEAAALVA